MGASEGADTEHISIHALLAESDHLVVFGSDCRNKISIHALLAESDLLIPLTILLIMSFLSTLSLRRATLGALWVLSTQIFLSTLSLRRATGSWRGPVPD